jgi:propionyl-CoA carboxylase alpha chain
VIDVVHNIFAAAGQDNSRSDAILFEAVLEGRRVPKKQRSLTQRISDGMGSCSICQQIACHKYVHAIHIWRVERYQQLEEQQYTTTMSSSKLFLRAAREGRARSRISSIISKRTFSSAAATAATSEASAEVQKQPPFNKILIANRGEITLRIIRTAQSLGIQTVSIYSTADSKSLHVQMADEAVCIGPPASSDSYLDIDKVCEAIVVTGVEGVHPGYGFLSENASFAERVEELMVSSNEINNNKKQQKVKFIGPSSHAIHSLGDKIQSKLIAEAAGVSTIPGYNGVVTSPEHALEIAHDIGYPVMIKASSGGGGKGMRICYNDTQVKEGYRLGSAEAKSFFGDDRLLVEKYVEDPHHIEIQVLSGCNPTSGELDILCFAERECSIQRRNQKVIEESPSPHLLPETRREMIRQVKSLVREVNYESAGTVSLFFFTSTCLLGGLLIHIIFHVFLYIIKKG